MRLVPLYGMKRPELTPPREDTAEDGKNTPRCPLITDHQPQGSGKYVSIVHITQCMVLLGLAKTPGQQL